MYVVNNWQVREYVLCVCDLVLGCVWDRLVLRCCNPGSV